MKRVPLVLRPLSEDDIRLIEPWFGEAAAVVHQVPEPAHIQLLEYQLVEAKTAKGDLLALVVDSAPIGVLDYRLDAPGDGWVTIGVLAVAAARRGRGYGAEAVRLLEDRVAAERYLANVNPRNGLSLYFWLRVGYRPAKPEEAFWHRPEDGGIISMIRTAGV